MKPQTDSSNDFAGIRTIDAILKARNMCQQRLFCCALQRPVNNRLTSNITGGNTFQKASLKERNGNIRATIGLAKTNSKVRRTPRQPHVQPEILNRQVMEVPRAPSDIVQRRGVAC